MPNVTKPRRVTYFNAPALVWEVRERGAASTRTMFTQWVEDGQHWEFGEARPMDNGGTFTPGGWVAHKAGETWARTVTGNFQRTTGNVLVADHRLPKGTPTDVVLYA